MEWRRAVKTEHDAQNEMLDAGETAKEKSGEGRTMSIISVWGGEIR